MHDPVIKTMIDANKKYSDNVVHKLMTTIEPFIEAAETAEKWDEALFVFVYHRKWNDYLMAAKSVKVKNSSLTATDVDRIDIQWADGFFNYEDEKDV